MEARTWTLALGDGRTVQIRHQPMPGGGWVAAHEDITEIKATRDAANERLSLQALIDRLPDNLWVKDVKSRFVIANQATATRIGVAGPRIWSARPTSNFFRRSSRRNSSPTNRRSSGPGNR